MSFGNIHFIYAVSLDLIKGVQAKRFLFWKVNVDFLFNVGSGGGVWDFVE